MNRAWMSARPSPTNANAASTQARGPKRGSKRSSLIRCTTIQEIRGMITWNREQANSPNCSALRYTRRMPAEITTEEYRALAQLRYLIRHFVSEGDTVSRAVGLEPQQYLLLLSVRGLPDGEEATIRTLAERLALKHHSVVELIDRLEANGYVRRTRGREDRRRVLVFLLPRGERMLEQVARHRIGELRATGHALVRTIDQLLEKTAAPRSSVAKKPARKRAHQKRG